MDPDILTYELEVLNEVEQEERKSQLELEQLEEEIANSLTDNDNEVVHL